MDDSDKTCPISLNSSKNNHISYMNACKRDFLLMATGKAKNGLFFFLIHVDINEQRSG